MRAHVGCANQAGLPKSKGDGSARDRSSERRAEGAGGLGGRAPSRALLCSQPCSVTTTIPAGSANGTTSLVGPPASGPAATPVAVARRTCRAWKVRGGPSGAGAPQEGGGGGRRATPRRGVKGGLWQHQPPGLSRGVFAPPCTRPRLLPKVPAQQAVLQ